MSKVQTNLTSRRTVYKFKEQNIPDEIIAEALEAASNAPCHKHTHPWRFYSIGNNTRKSLIPSISRLARIKSEKKKSNNVDADIQRAVSKIISAPVLFAIPQRKVLMTISERRKIMLPVCVHFTTWCFPFGIMELVRSGLPVLSHGIMKPTGFLASIPMNKRLLVLFEPAILFRFQV